MSNSHVVKLILKNYDYLTSDDVVRRLRYSTFVNLRKKYLYFEVPKAACTRMKEILLSLEGGQPAGLTVGGVRDTRREMFVHYRQNIKLPSLIDLDNDTQRRVLESPDFFRFTIVRNPYTRLLSAWRNKILLCEPGQQAIYSSIKGSLPALNNKALVSFREFIDYVTTHCDLRTCDPHWRCQVDHLFYKALNLSTVGKLETMNEALRRFATHLGLADSFVNDNANVSASGGSAGYDQSTADKVYRMYRDDFATLGYDRTLWPSGDPDSVELDATHRVRGDKFADEVIERNIVISLLYEERDRLQAQIDRASWFHLLRRVLVKITSSVFVPVSDLLHRRTTVKARAVTQNRGIDTEESRGKLEHGVAAVGSGGSGREDLSQARGQSDDLLSVEAAVLPGRGKPTT